MLNFMLKTIQKDDGKYLFGEDFVSILSLIVL